MNKKHINAQLCKVFNQFLESIENEEIKDLLRKGTIITGGSIVSLLQGETPHDYDLYFKDFKTCYKVAEYFVNKFNDDKKEKKAVLKIQTSKELIEGVEKWIVFDDALKEIADNKEPRIKIFIQSEGVAGNEEVEDDEMQTNITPQTDMNECEETPKYKPKFLTSNAISLTEKIQLVIRFYGDPGKIHDNYDFVHCTNYWTSWDRKVLLKLEAVEAIINKELIYVGSKYPLCSIVRTRKFINRGWTINAGQYLKMCMQLNELDLKNVQVLEDQLVGVDSTYFKMLINALEEKQKSDNDFKVSSSYVATIVDKIF
ncbi:hypothetical protein K5V21_13910 [Clostridium sardiniense]|uniref:Nucleotidyl transferase AbiEii/AbiGii toxin family protein n=1 Tax=Clostridium sardiniense TaxID=29369 RepID=A0ABS7L0E6_CLOSR|nr:hypothetical protein [Clostridium sardiniense]MBY0756539.1 hypothetical protein [Clostridium sardiniense]MDQ0460288.1 hypothetical protein [Clostridium sardiniense]